MLNLTMATLPLLTACGNAAFAQGAAAPAADNASAGTPLGDIVVTARKRKENLLDVPVAISAMGADKLDALNVKTMEQIVAVTPGMSLNNATSGAARSDRSKTAIIIRGMSPSVGNQTSSTFVNGVPISDGIVTSIFDYDHVEVLKGPQSAYFGRQTFGGAVNLVTKEPTDTFTGDLSALAATGNHFDFNGAIGGPLIPGILSFRVGARYFESDGTWKNNAEPGHTLGDQSTRSGTLSIKFTPSPDLTVKLFGAIGKDDDGAGATGVLDASQSNCEIGGNPYFCGTLPALAAGQPSARTEVTPGVAALLKDYSPLFSSNDNIDHFGMLRHTTNLSASVEYDLGFATINSLTGYNKDDWTVLYQLNGRASPYEAPITGFPYQDYTDWPLGIQHKQRDFSQEFRLTSKQDQPLRWMIGGSYLWQRGDERFMQLYYFSGLSMDNSATNESKTWGGFFSLAYDITDKLTINAEGRYQSDKLISRDGGTYEIGYQKTYKNFMPRVSLEYHPSTDTMLYATYSKGVNPGLGKDPLLSVPSDYVDDLLAMGVSHGVKPETLDNYEVGFKGKLFDGRLVFQGDVYYDIWKNKITESTVLIPRENSTPVFVSVFTNLGKVILKGIELQATAEPVDGLIVDLAGAIADSNIRSGDCSFCTTMTGDGDAKGNQLPNSSKYTAQGSVEYSAGFVPLPDFKWYGRAEFNYKSGMYESEGNYVKTQASKVFNFRAGLRSDRMSIEAFVTNAFNNKAYTSLLPDWELDNPSQTFAVYDTMYVGLPELRRVGVKIGYHF
ncbi:TonB-dependent receptor [Novosphingobium resinovorum]|uniref:TonB-dependent receptor n=1 Tax=Novosphingobium resinovorum TaxID=158500 RepID=UPI002ED10E21|nr:TonB-dependent receptor [Novosphingobium resinovorum]